MRGVGVLQYNKADMETYVGTLHDRLLKDTDCRFCGACAEVCPTGAIQDAKSFTAVEKHDKLLPCVANCPAQVDIPRYLRYAKENRLGDAAAVLREKLPFPGVLGRVCNHKCEEACRRGELNEAISIRNVKRYIADMDKQMAWKSKARRMPLTGRTVCVVGGGPAGMTAAIYLSKRGHSVTLKEAMPKLGGQLRYGIPEYRLPRDILDSETDYITQVGVTVECDCKVACPEALLREYDAVLVTTGTGAGVRLPIPGNDLQGVLLNTDFLRDVSTSDQTGIGERVVVLGGGNVAFDCARSAKRLGAREVSVVCLESRGGMLADPEEIEQAAEEGVIIYPSSSFEEICGETRVSGVRIMTVSSFRFDENHNTIIKKEPGSERIIEADTVIFAVGQRPSPLPESALELKRGYIALIGDGTMKTSIEGVFACGDVVYGTASVIEAIAAGREAASEIDIWLGGDGDISETLAPTERAADKIGIIEGFYGLKRAEELLLPAQMRSSGFSECSGGLSGDNVCAESGRCLQCQLRLQIEPARTWTDYVGKGVAQQDAQ